MSFMRALAHHLIIGCLILLSGAAVADARLARPRHQTELTASASPQSQALPPKPERGNEPQEGATILKEKTEVVTVTVTVTDPDNRPVTGLGRQHFEVFDDKVKQEIGYFRDEDVPLSLGIVFDVSGSMQGKIDRARDALKAFIQTSHREDDFFLITFNEQPRLVAEFTDSSTLVGKLDLVTPHGNTALIDAVYLGLEKAAQGHHRKRALLLISDGQDNASRYSFGNLRQLLKESDTQIYCIGISEQEIDIPARRLRQAGRLALEEIAQITGGKAFFPRSAEEMEVIISRLAVELRHQYSLGYVPTGVQRDGKWHRIKVRIDPSYGPSCGPNCGLPPVTVRAKEGYYAVP